MSLPHHSHHHHHHHHHPNHHPGHMPGLLQPIIVGGGGGVGVLNHPAAGHPSLMSAHLFDHIQPPPPPPQPSLLGTMDSQCAGTSAATLDNTAPTAAATKVPPDNSSSDDQFPSQDMLLALIARNKALEGECKSVELVEISRRVKTLWGLGLFGLWASRHSEWASGWLAGRFVATFRISYLRFAG